MIRYLWGRSGQIIDSRETKLLLSFPNYARYYVFDTFVPCTKLRLDGPADAHGLIATGLSQRPKAMPCPYKATSGPRKSIHPVNVVRSPILPSGLFTPPVLRSPDAI